MIRRTFEGLAGAVFLLATSGINTQFETTDPMILGDLQGSSGACSSSTLFWLGIEC